MSKSVSESGKRDLEKGATKIGFMFMIVDGEQVCCMKPLHEGTATTSEFNLLKLPTCFMTFRNWNLTFQNAQRHCLGLYERKPTLVWEGPRSNVEQLPVYPHLQNWPNTKTAKFPCAVKMPFLDMFCSYHPLRFLRLWVNISSTCCTLLLQTPHWLTKLACVTSNFLLLFSVLSVSCCQKTSVSLNLDASCSNSWK